MRKWKVERRKKGKWDLVGMYNENFIEQLAACVAWLTRKGYRIYETIRVREVRKDG